MSDVRHSFSWFGGEAGDVVFVYSRDPGAWITRLGQRILRGWPWRRQAPPSLYSHVALVADFGVIIHADGKKTRFQPLRERAPAFRPDGDFRIVRPDPPLTREQQATMIAAAQRYMDQRYFFGYRLGTSWTARGLRWLAGGSSGQSLPFCSQLVALAYAAAGLPLLPAMVPDEVLPLDLDLLMRGPGWREVTDLYYVEPLHALLGRAGVTPPSVTLDEEAMTNDHLQFLVLSHDTFRGWNSVLDAQDKATALHERFTETILRSPESVVERAPDFAADLLAEVDQAYSVVLGFPASFPASALDLLAAATPHIPQDIAPVEGGLTLEEARVREQRHKAALFVNRVLRTDAVMRVLAEEIVARPSDPADWVPILLSAVPPLGGAKRKAVALALDRMANALGADDAVVARLRVILELHQVFRRATARPRPRRMPRPKP